MDLGSPHTALIPSLEGEVLMTLSGTRRPLTGRDIARLVRTGSQRGIHLALKRLVVHGIVEAQGAGRAILYTLNRAHLAAPAVELLAGLRPELIRRLREAIQEWRIQPVHASLFGSAARGDGDTSSDIDLFVVRPSAVGEADPHWRTQLERLARDVRSWTGNPASVSEAAVRDLRRLRNTRPAIVESLEKDGVTLAGKPFPKLMRATR